MKAGKPALAALALLLVAPESHSADTVQYASPTTFDLGEVVVTYEGEAVQSSQTVRRIDEQEIRESGAATLDEALALTPGLNLRMGPEGVPRMGLRGFRTRHVKLLLDSIPVNSSFDQQFDPTMIPTENLEEIKVTSGTSSVLYGQGGLGGVINLITKKGSEGSGGSIGVETSPVDDWLAKGATWGATPKADWFISASARKSEGYRLSGDFASTAEEDGGLRENSQRERLNLFGNFGYSPSDDLTLSLAASHGQGAYGKPPSVVNDPFDPFASSPKYVKVDPYAADTLQLAADWALTDGVSLRGWAFRNQSTSRTTQYDDSAYKTFTKIAGSYRSTTKSLISGASLQPRFDLRDSGVVTLALSVEEDRWQEEGTAALAPGLLGPIDKKADYRISTIGAQYEATLDALGFSAGLARHALAGQGDRQSEWTFSTGAHWDFASDKRLKVSAGRNIRFPTLADLYDSVKGNRDLLPEKTVNFEAGVEKRLPDGSRIALTGFTSRVRNLIQSDQESGLNVNLSKTTFTGAELTLDLKATEKLDLSGSYTRLEAKDRSRPGREELQYTPKDKAALEASYRIDELWQCRASLLYVGGQFYYTKNNVTPVQKGRLRDYVLADARLTRKVLQDRAELYLGVDNILDRNYETSYGFPQPGRRVYVGVEKGF